MKRNEAIDMSRLLETLVAVMDRQTVDSAIGRIIMPAPNYLGMWARDTGIIALGLNRLGKRDLARELLVRYWGFQITPHCKPSQFIFRNKGRARWTEDMAFTPSREQLLKEVGGFPTSVYIDNPMFPAGTREVYTTRCDLDSACWLIVALDDYLWHSKDVETVCRLSTAIHLAVDYLRSRDVDGDGLLEQGPNEDWADTLLRHGTVTYTQALWCRALEAAARLLGSCGDAEKSQQCCVEKDRATSALRSRLRTGDGSYVDYRSNGFASTRLSLDSSLLVGFHLVDDAVQLLGNLESLKGRHGISVICPGFATDEIGPGTYRLGQYQNTGIWPWITAYYALGWAKAGHRDRARRLVCGLFHGQPDTVYEWFDSETGQENHPDFATAAGALAWAITEGGLA